ISVTFPANGGTYSTSTFNSGCSPTGVCGAVNFNNSSSSRTIGVIIKRNGDNQYWNGTTFSGTTEIFNSVTCPSPCTSNANIAWTYALAAPADGSYTVRARGADSGTPGGVISTANTFTIDSTNPTTASVDTPANGASFNAATAPTTLSGTAADNAGGSG